MSRQPGDRMPAPPELALAQDLANTIDIERDADSLRTPDDLAAFASRHSLQGLAFGSADLAHCLQFREALRAACLAHAGEDVPEPSARLLADALSRAPVVVSIDRTGVAAVAAAPNLDGADALIAHVAASIVAAEATGTWPRLKACAASDCRWVYYDHSPAGRGRWCTMKICGSRAKVRSWRERQATP